MRATIIADASWCPISKAAGWAVWLVINGKRDLAAGEIKGTCDSSSEAELKAILNGIHVASARGAIEILIRSDSRHALEIIDKEHRDWKKYSEIISPLIDGKKIRTRWVKGHTAYRKGEKAEYCNRWCDEQARKHMKIARLRLMYSGGVVEKRPLTDAGWMV